MEFAVTFPFLLVLAVSIADYGYYLEHVNNITTVVRDATRYASENTTAVSWSPACPNPTWSGSTVPIRAQVTTAASGNVEGLIQYEAESLTVPEEAWPWTTLIATGRRATPGCGRPLLDRHARASQPRSGR